MLRLVVLHTVIISAAIGVAAGGALLLFGDPREAWGLLFGTAIGISNQVMLASRVARIGAWSSARQTRMMLRMGSALRFLMIGMAALVAIKLHTSLSLEAMLVGVIFPIVVANVAGARLLMRPDL